MQRLRDPGLLAQAVSRSARHGQVAAPDNTPTLLTLVGAFVLLALVIATATWVPA